MMMMMTPSLSPNDRPVPRHDPLERYQPVRIGGGGLGSKTPKASGVMMAMVMMSGGGGVGDITIMHGPDDLLWRSSSPCHLGQH